MTRFDFYSGPWENARHPTIVRDDPEGGDPHVIATLARIHNPDALYELCRMANSLAALRKRVVEVLEPIGSLNASTGENLQLARWSGLKLEPLLSSFSFSKAAALHAELKGDDT